MKLYYGISPAMARWISPHDSLKQYVSWAIGQMVGAVEWITSGSAEGKNEILVKLKQGVGNQRVLTIIAETGGVMTQHLKEIRTYRVRFKNRASAQAAIEKLRMLEEIEGVEPNYHFRKNL